MFIDSAKVVAQAGKGGDGLTSWRRERFVARGGPDGGDGGRGGDIIFIGDHNLNTLSPFRNRPLLKAADGQAGRRRKSHGKSAEDNIIKVPMGTIVWYQQTQITDIAKDGQSVVVAKGGRGGFGNAHFTSSTRQAPAVAEVGEPGEAKELELELKLLADVGLVGMPNAGKSTLLSVVSNAKPEIADYPFTTLAPNLGVVDVDNNTMLMADIPGLIEGASKGKGLGDAFLRHIERTAVLLHLIDANGQDVAGDYQTIIGELKAYKLNLSKRPQIVVLTKIDAIDQSEAESKLKQLKKISNQPVFAISSVAHTSLDELLRATVKLVTKARQTASKLAQTKPKIPVLTLADDPEAWWIERKAGKYIICGTKIEGFGRRTNFSSRDGEERLRDILRKQGITRELLRLGVKIGDEVSIAGKDFKW